MPRALVLTLAAGAVLGSLAFAADSADRRRALDHYRAGKALMRTESWADAEPEFRQAVRLDPLLVVAHYDLGQTLMALKRYPDAIQVYLGCQRAYRESAERGVSNEAAALESREDQIRTLQDDIQILRTEMSVLPANNSSQRQRIAFRIMRIESQIDSLKRLRGVEGRAVEAAPEISLALGSAYFRAGDAAAAEREYVVAVDLDPKLGEAHNNLAVIYMMSGRLDEAEKAVKLAEKGGVKVSPDLKKELEARRKAVVAP